MDTSEKIKVFDNFEALADEIEKDKASKDLPSQRYPIRFIMLNNFNEFRALAKFMVDKGVDSLDLENLIDEGEDDVWITKDELKKAIKACTTSTFVTPFSELVRFFNDDEFRGFFNEIMLLEDINHPQKRIYVPLIGLQNRFTDFLNHFARIKESAPIWRYDADPQSVEVYFTKYKDFALPNGEERCLINSLRAWLKFWKVQAPQKRIVCTSAPIAAKYKFSKPDNIFNFTRIANAYEFMTRFLDMTFPFEYTDSEKSYWEDMPKFLHDTDIKSFSYEAFVRKHFNKVEIKAEDVLTSWVDENTSSFGRWLLAKYCLHTPFKERSPYITICIENVVDYENSMQLPNTVATLMLYNKELINKGDYACERSQLMLSNKEWFRNIITQETQNWLFTRTKETFQMENTLEEAVKLCTGVFDYEKILLMRWYTYHPNKNTLKEAVKNFFPELNAYMKITQPTHFAPETQWCIDYSDAYKRAKLKDEYSNEIASFIKEYNCNAESFYQWYFTFTSSHDALADATNDSVFCPDKVYWIDGLGMEFLSYLIYLVEKEHSSFKIVRSQITRSDLPTSTDNNRFVGDNVNKFGALDELGHDSHRYQHFTTLNEELKVLKKIVHEIIGSNKNNVCTIAIVSDHGLSCLSRKAPSKKYEGRFEHEGRYIEITSGADQDSDYLVCTSPNDGKKYKVALTHSSLSKAPTHQVHGGCTPEEVLVPFILLSNKSIATNTKYKITLLSGDIMLSKPLVTLSIMPEPKNVTLTFKGKVYEMERMETKWQCILKNVTEGIHSIFVKPEGATSNEIKVNIVGIGNNNNIDDIFDL